MRPIRLTASNDRRDAPPLLVHAVPDYRLHHQHNVPRWIKKRASINRGTRTKQA